MSTPAINAVRLTKRYRTGSNTWLDAVHDVSFDVAAGEAVGLLGRNGAGKSTLLKILSRVTRPTSGYADVYGRVGALLEVGTGFHPDLSGRENTYLSGAMLGLSKAEVRARFDEVVAFAEIEDFIDMPVKRYSSGMYARLGFAVAAHLRPEILIVDEVLAVGDLPFQAKCLAVMHGLAESGTTVLFVSHNLLAVADLCTRALVLADGEVRFDGRASDAIVDYRGMLAQPVVTSDPAHDSSIELAVNGTRDPEIVSLEPNAALSVSAAINRETKAPSASIVLNLVIEAPDGRIVVHLRNDLVGSPLELRPDRTMVGVTIDELSLAPGSYWMWCRVVGLDASNPLLLDSKRLLLNVRGDQALDAVVIPHHRFEQDASQGIHQSTGARA